MLDQCLPLLIASGLFYNLSRGYSEKNPYDILYAVNRRLIGVHYETDRSAPTPEATVSVITGGFLQNIASEVGSARPLVIHSTIDVNDYTDDWCAEGLVTAMAELLAPPSAE